MAIKDLIEKYKDTLIALHRGRQLTHEDYLVIGIREQNEKYGVLVDALKNIYSLGCSHGKEYDPLNCMIYLQNGATCKSCVAAYWASTALNEVGETK